MSDYRCNLCGRKLKNWKSIQRGKVGKTEKHHIKTKGSGGNDAEDNLIEVCRICHTKIHMGEIKI